MEPGKLLLCAQYVLSSATLLAAAGPAFPLAAKCHF